MRIFLRVAAVAGLLLVSSGAAVVRPAWACGCGAMVSSSPVRISEETSIVRYDSATRTEEIVMMLSASSTAKDAAWLFPTPSEARVKLGERGWFAELEELTKPRVVKRRIWFPLPLGRGGGAGAGDSAPGASGGVRVLGERDLGPFRVATLDAKDPGALARWLDGNGYKLSPELEKGLAPYVKEGWKYVAVKLRPQHGRALTGELAPLHVSFASDHLVYPMRLSRLAKNAQSVHLYVLWTNRVWQLMGYPMDLTFAGRVTPDQVRSPGLRRFLGDGLFMTELVARGIHPERIREDHYFDADRNVPYRQVIVDEEVVRFLGMPAGWLIVFGGAGPVVIAGVAQLVKRLVKRGRSRTAAS